MKKTIIEKESQILLNELENRLKLCGNIEPDVHILPTSNWMIFIRLIVEYMNKKLEDKNEK